MPNPNFMNYTPWTNPRGGCQEAAAHAADGFAANVDRATLAAAAKHNTAEVLRLGLIADYCQQVRASLGSHAITGEATLASGQESPQQLFKGFRL